MASGGKGGGGSKSYDYYGTFALRFGVGPMDELLALERNGNIIWPKAKKFDALSWVGGSIVFHEGRFYQTPTTTTNTPPASPWVPYSLLSSTAVANGYTTLTVEGVGQCRFYWGKETQTPDAYLSNAAKTATTDNPDGHEHPAYKGICYAVFEDCLLGRENTSPGNWRAWVRRKPVQSVVTGTPSNLTDSQANPAAVVAEFLTSKYCAGIPSGDLDGVSFQAAADKLQTKPELVCLSPSIERQTQVVGSVDDTSAHSELFLRWDSETAKVVAGVWEHGTVPASFVTVTEKHLTEPARITPGAWAESKTGAAVRYRDRVALFKERPTAIVPDLRAQRILGRAVVESLDRPWITRESQAEAHASQWLRARGGPRMSASIRMRRQFALGTGVVGDPFRYGVKPGDWIQLDIDPEPGGGQLLQFFRVLDRKIPLTGPIEIGCEADVTLTPVAYQPPPGAPLFASPNNPDALTVFRILDCPPQLGGFNHVLALAQRPSSMHVGFNLWFDSNVDNDALFDDLGAQRFFAVRCGLHANLAANAAGDLLELPAVDEAITVNGAVTSSTTVQVTHTGTAWPENDFVARWFAGAVLTVGATTANVVNSTAPNSSGIVTLTLDAPVTLATAATGTIIGEPLKITVAPQVDDRLLAEVPPGRVKANDDSLLLFLIETASGNVAESSGVGQVEVLSVLDWYIEDAGPPARYVIRALRARRGTQKTAFTSANCEAWLIRREALTSFEHRDFAVLRSNRQRGLTPDEATFRLQPLNNEATRSLDDCADVPFKFPTQSLARPTLTWTAPGVTSWPYTFGSSAGGTLQLRGSWSDADGDLVSMSLTQRQGAGPELTLVSETIPRRGNANFDKSVSLTSPGTYTFTARAADSTGIATEVIVTATVPAGGGGQVAQPTFNPDEWSYFLAPQSITVSCATSGADLTYKVVDWLTDPGTPTPGSSGWSALAAAPVTVVVGAGKKIYAQARKAGMTDSEVGVTGVGLEDGSGL